MQRPIPERSTAHRSPSLRRRLVDAFYLRYVPTLPPGSRVLDLGGTRIAKRGSFDIEQYNLQITYANLSAARLPHVQADAAVLPFAPATFDAVICSELLEHVAFPLAVLYEVRAVLREGGMLLLTTPFLYRIHGDPHDYARYTDHFWRDHLQNIGFAVLSIEHQGMFYSVLADMFWQYVRHVGVPRPFGRLARQTTAAAHTLALGYEQQARVQQHPFLRSFSTGFGVVARKVPRLALPAGGTG